MSYALKICFPELLLLESTWPVLPFRSYGVFLWPFLINPMAIPSLSPSEEHKITGQQKHTKEHYIARASNITKDHTMPNTQRGSLQGLVAPCLTGQDKSIHCVGKLMHRLKGDSC